MVNYVVYICLERLYRERERSYKILYLTLHSNNEKEYTLDILLTCKDAYGPKLPHSEM